MFIKCGERWCCGDWRRQNQYYTSKVRTLCRWRFRFTAGNFFFSIFLKHELLLIELVEILILIILLLSLFLATMGRALTVILKKSQNIETCIYQTLWASSVSCFFILCQFSFSCLSLLLAPPSATLTCTAGLSAGVSHLGSLSILCLVSCSLLVHGTFRSQSGWFFLVSQGFFMWIY